MGRLVVCEAKLRKALSLVFKTFLRDPVGTRGLWVGNIQGGSVFGALSIDFLAIDERKYFVLQLCPSGSAANRAIDARNAMSCLQRSRGHIGTPRRLIGRSTD